MANFKESENLTANMKECFLQLEIDISKKHKQIEYLTNDLKRERQERMSLQGKLNKMTEAFVQIHGELAEILTNLRGSNQGNVRIVQRFHGNEHQHYTETFLRKLNHLSNQVQEKFEKCTANRKQIRCELQVIHDMLKKLDDMVNEKIESDMDNCSSASSDIIVIRDDYNISDSDKLISTSPRVAPTDSVHACQGQSINIFPSISSFGYDNNNLLQQQQNSRSQPETTPTCNQAEISLDQNRLSKRISIKPVRLVDELMMQQRMKEIAVTLKEKEKAKQMIYVNTTEEHGIGNCKQHGTSRKEFYCLCGLVYIHEWELMKHVNYHSYERRMFACHLCVQRFHSAGHLKIHLSTRHKIKLDETVSRMVGCTKCGGMFDSRKELQNHQSTEHKLSPQVDIPFTKIIHNPATKSTGSAIGNQVIRNKKRVLAATPQQLGKDGRYHGIDSGGPEFHCACGNKFKRSNALIEHIAYFTSEGKFSCEVCGRRFLGANYLRKHMIQAHKYNPGNYLPSYGCRRCGKLLPTYTQLILHRRMKHKCNRMKP